MNFAKMDWCDLWHQHLDPEGFGSLGWMHRRRHLSALLTALSRARIELTGASKPYQLFAIINRYDAGDDAIFVHTKNPNGTQFPIMHEGDVVSLLPPFLAGLVDLSRYRVISQRSSTADIYIIEPL